jgi:hypothetical protein
LPRDGVTGTQVKLADLRRGDIDVVRAGEIVVFGGAQETETIGEALEDAFGEDQTVLFGLGSEDLKDQLLLAHAGCAGDIQLLGDFRQVGDIFFFQLGKADTHLIVTFNACFLHMSLTFIGEL